VIVLRTLVFGLFSGCQVFDWQVLPHLNVCCLDARLIIFRRIVCGEISLRRKHLPADRCAVDIDVCIQHIIGIMLVCTSPITINSSQGVEQVYKDVRGAAFQQAFSAAFLPGDCAFIVRPLLRGAY